ncbi:hypothetical protein RDWZM_009775 [Blomia tropicalis]|uniref:Cuticlin-1 n=1 Tax=Blomia tropicalis TaxID=40697 RepID=A0A9Q0RK06_BLOTA|nr:hypothetical protein RDWZM_009775 [Blomia tropicalis]
MSFEKIASVTIRGVPFVPLYNGQPDIPVTAECNNRCRAGPKCRAFLLSYDKHQCFGFDYDSVSRGLSVVSSASEKTNYFEKICLSTAPCEKAWTFERVMGRELKGFDNRVLSGVASRLRCQELCLKERSFVCRSGEYDYASQQCRLSSEDRRSQPTAFRLAPTSSIDYFENQCAATQQQQQQASGSGTVPGTSTALGSSVPTPVSCDFERYENLDINRADLIRTAFSMEQCKQLCEATRAFVCRSFTYAPSTSQCWLSSDDLLAVPNGISGLESHTGATYYQRQHCLDLQLFCSHDSMSVSLNTIDPFNGRLYSKEDPTTCESMGRSSTNTVLTLPFNPRSACGVREEDGKYTSMVVIQHHPMIQRKGDRIVHVACHFEATNRTISNTYSVLVEMPSVAETSIVNATAPSPNIRLRITDKEGQDITGARLGDELFLRIELDDDEVFGIFARELIAKSGNNQNESIMLIDADGCPTDPNIFPTLERIPNSKGLMGKFDAFKFADDVVVRFQVNVQFCLQECLPVQCDNSRHSDSETFKTANSWGRRRRRDTHQHHSQRQTVMSNQTELHREIIVEGMKNKKEALKNIDRTRDEIRSSMFCTSKVTLIIGFITMVMLEITIFGSCLACFLIYKRVPNIDLLSKQQQQHQKAGHHHHPPHYRRSGLAQIIEGLRVDHILPRTKAYTAHLENDDCMSSTSSCCSGSAVSDGTQPKPMYTTSMNVTSSSKTNNHLRSSYPVSKGTQMWTQINRIE